MNVIDELKSLSVEEIKNWVSERTLPFAVIMMQIKGDFNFSTVIRNGNAFGAKEIFYYGPRKKYDKRGCVGVFNYTPVNWINIEHFEQIKELRSTYPHFVALDIIPGISKPIFEHKWESGTLIFLGEEGLGLSKEFLDICDEVVHIPQRGSVRSINVGTASGIAMYDFSMRFI